MAELGLPLAVVGAYAAALVAIAAWAERAEARGLRVASNRWTYSLSLGVYATTWTFYGSVGLAARDGLLFLSVYLGPTLCAIGWWWVLRRMVKLKERHRVTGLADLLALLFGKSQRVALAATGVLVVGLVPYLALQLKTMIFTLALVAGGGRGLRYPEAGEQLGPPIVALMLAFTIAFGLRRVRPSERHPGMVVALAFEVVVKLVAFVAAGAFVVWGLFDGPGDVFRRSLAPDAPTPALIGGHGVLTWLSHLVLSAGAILLLPRQFHVAVVENADEDHVRTAMWLLPAYLLAITVLALPLALGGLLLGHPASEADTYVLHLPLDAGRPLLSWLVFLGGFSAGIGMVVVETTALATMISNDVVIPAAERIRPLKRARRHVLPLRWASAALLLAAAFGYERVLGRGDTLSSMGFISFAAVLQLAPALLGGLFWRGASTAGALAGLAAGFLTWVHTLVVPVLVRVGWLPAELMTEGPLGIATLRPEGLFDVDLDPVSHAVLFSLLFNTGALVAGSLLFPPRAALERPEAAGLAPDGPPDPTSPDALVPAAGKREEAAALLARYHGEGEAAQLAARCLAAVGAEPAGALSPLQLAALQGEVETALAASIGSAGAHAAIRRHPLVSPEEARAVSAAYAEVLASLNVSPAELQQKLDYHRERERLLARDAANQRFLAGVSGLLAGSLDLEETARTAVRLPLGVVADAALLWLAPLRGPPRAYLGDVDSQRERAAAAATEGAAEAAALGGVAPLLRALETRHPVVQRPVEPREWGDRLGPALPGGAAVTLPLLAARGPVGTLSLFVEDGTRLRPGDELALAEELARRLALAVENARLYHEAEAAVRARDEFLAVASHELKTPLTPLRLKIQTLERLVARGDLAAMPQERLMQLFGGAEGQVLRLVGLVDDLLDVTRLTTHRLRLRVEPVDLADVVGEVVERHASDAAAAGSTVHVDAARPVLGSWDRLRVEQVFTNLLTNAFKYAPGARVEVSVRGEGPHAVLVVRDEGPGIAPPDQERIFRPFERAVRFLEVSGFGLGLFIVRQIVEAHGGTVRLESSPGQGSAFRIELPRAGPPAQA
jgi:signal transduction histidine kinase/Na+/proline symporter